MSRTEESENKVQPLKEQIKRDAIELVLSKFPRNILYLDSLLKEQRFDPNSKLDKVVVNIPVPDAPLSANANTLRECLFTSVKKQKRDNQSCDTDQSEEEDLIVTKVLFPMGVVESNQHLTQMLRLLKPLMLELLQDSVSLKMGINLMIPQIEDGNNFGVEVQQEIIELIAVVEDDIHLRLDAIVSYFTLRGDLIAKVAKYPHADDYRNAVQERDEKFHLHLCLTLTYIRNHFANLHDLVIKNLNKIKQPRSQSNKDMMY